MLGFSLIASQTPNPAGASTIQTVWEFLSSGGPVMVPLGVCSVVALALVLERLLSLQREKIIPARITEAVDLLGQRQVDRAEGLAEELAAPASRILKAGIRRQGLTVQEIEKAMEDQAQKEVAKLQGKIQVLNLIANIAPLLGLLGTVIGIAEAFHRVVKTGLGKPQHLAGGIEQALTTTITGLVIAIPIMLLAAYLSARLRRYMMHTDEVLAPAVEFLAVAKKEESNAA